MKMLYNTPFGETYDPVGLEVVDKTQRSYGSIPYIQGVEMVLNLESPDALRVECLYSSVVRRLLPCDGHYLIRVEVNGFTRLFVPREVTITGKGTEDDRVIIECVCSKGVLWGVDLLRGFKLLSEYQKLYTVLWRTLETRKESDIVEGRDLFHQAQPIDDGDNSPNVWFPSETKGLKVGEWVSETAISRGWYLTTEDTVINGEYRIGLRLKPLPSVKRVIGRGNGHVEQWKYVSSAPRANVGWVEWDQEDTNKEKYATHYRSTSASGWEIRDVDIFLPGKRPASHPRTVGNNPAQDYLGRFQQSAKVEVELSPDCPITVGGSTGKGMRVNVGELLEVELQTGWSETFRILSLTVELTPTSFTVTPELGHEGRTGRQVWDTVSALQSKMDFIAPRVQGVSSSV